MIPPIVSKAIPYRKTCAVVYGSLGGDANLPLFYSEQADRECE